MPLSPAGLAPYKGLFLSYVATYAAQGETQLPKSLLPQAPHGDGGPSNSTSGVCHRGWPLVEGGLGGSKAADTHPESPLGEDRPGRPQEQPRGPH